MATDELEDASLWIETDSAGLIEAIGRETARLLGLSPRGAYARDLRMFFPASYHPISSLMSVAHHQPVEGLYRLHPRDRRPVDVRLRIAPFQDLPRPERERGVLQWTLELAETVNGS